MNLNQKNYAVIALVAAVFFIPFLGGVHLFDWDEINFAEISREMIVLEDYLRVHINFVPFWEKPPLFMWLQVLSMKSFGINEFSARFPNAVCGVLTLVFLYKIGSFLKGERFGWLWVGAYFGSILPFLYFKSGIIDPWFNLLIFIGLYYLILFYWKKENVSGLKLKNEKWFYLLLSGIAVGLAVLTKGPVAFLIICLVLGVYWISQRFRFFINPGEFIVFTSVLLVVCGIWFGLEILKNGTWFVEKFITYQIELLTKPVAGHQGFLGYHFVVLLIGVFPASIFAIRGFFKMPSESEFYISDFRKWMKYLFWVVLILFSLVQSKIVHYSSLCYFPLTYLAATVMEKIWIGEISFSKYLKSGVLFIGGVYILVLGLLPFAGMNIEVLKPLFNKDPFALANLDAVVSWSWFDIFPAVLFVTVLVSTFYYLKKENFKIAYSVLYGGMGIFTFCTLIFFINNIEGYSQNAAVEFWGDRKGEDCYVLTKDYKSYAHYFYSDKQPQANEKHSDQNWLLSGDIDKTLYLAAKINRAEQFLENPEFKELYRKNGFVFFKRESRK